MANDRHAPACPLWRTPNASRSLCTCENRGRSTAMTPGEMANVIDAPGTVRQQRARDLLERTRQEARSSDAPNGGFVNRTGSGYPKGGVDRNKPPESTNADILTDIVRTFSSMLGRPIALESIDHRGTLTIAQRCKACRADITSKVVAGADASHRIGHAIRHDYAAHQCGPVDVALHGCSVEEMDALLQSTEADVDRVCARYKAIEDELRRRQS